MYRTNDAPSVKEAFRHMFDAYAESPEQQLFTAGYEHVRVDTHLPVLDIPNLPTKQPDRVLSKAAIQGSFSTSRRDYHRFFADMIQSLHGECFRLIVLSRSSPFQMIPPLGDTTRWELADLSCPTINPGGHHSNWRWWALGTSTSPTSWRTWSLSTKDLTTQISIGSLQGWT